MPVENEPVTTSTCDSLATRLIVRVVRSTSSPMISCKPWYMCANIVLHTVQYKVAHSYGSAIESMTIYETM